MSCFIIFLSDSFVGMCKIDFGCNCIVYEFFCQQHHGEFQADAKATCEKLGKDMLFGGSLAIVDNEQTSNALFNFIDDGQLYDDWCIQKKGFWIGLKDYGPYEPKDAPPQHNFLWSNGYCLDFEDWAAGEPNDNRKKNNNGQNCVQLW
ncbi:collectin-12-like [Glandiceps talaboti]